MKYYDIFQLDPKVIKEQMKKTSIKKEKTKLGIGMFLRSVLLVLFAILFISTLSTAFGSQNSPMAVAIFCILLSLRFVDFGYCMKDELLALSVTFLILLFSPILATSVFPMLGFFINFISLFLILLITCNKPEMGNGGLFGFAYVYLSGNPVYGTVLIQRTYLTIVGFILCGIIFYIKHKNKNKDIKFIETVKQLEPTEFKYQWMMKMSLGISAILFIGMALGIERFMWAGFACSSLLSEYSQTPKIKERFINRLVGVIIGVVLFCFIYYLVPQNLHFLIGPLGGFCLGFCVNYRYKTIMNCFGALVAAVGIYGLQTSVFLRISNTILGIVFAFVFYQVYEKYISIRFNFINQATDNN